MVGEALPTTNQFEIDCQHVWREISNYIDGDLSAELRARIDAHLKTCRRCTAILDGTVNTIRLVGDGNAFDLPAGFSQRLKNRLQEAFKTQTIPLGISDDEIPLGSHALYYWETAEEFERGVRFLEIGLSGKDFCVLFGHEAANVRVLQSLQRSGFDVQALLATGRLAILYRELPAVETLAAIERSFQAAQQCGATVIRYLGNLGGARNDLPGGEDAVLQLEARVTNFARRFPCVMLCMYESHALSHRLMEHGGLHTHPYICGISLQHNPDFVPEEQFPARLDRANGSH